jgi:hypothetical protein
MIGVGYRQIESTLCDCGAGSETAGPLAVVISSPCCVQKVFPPLRWQPRDRSISLELVSTCGDINDVETIKVIVLLVRG